MRNLNKKTFAIAAATLFIGFALGGLFFGGMGSTELEHVHSIENGNEVWTCSMHPQIRQSQPGPCPLCGMDLIPVATDNEDDDRPMEISMSPTAMQLANVQTAIITKGRAIKELRLNGKIQVDEGYVSSQTTHISGRVEKLYINTTGEYVSKGKVIAEIYSPDLVTAQEELFEAQKMKELQPLLFEAAKNRLKNWKLTEKQIEDILASRKPKETFPILSDINGIVTSKRIQLGDYINRGASLFEVADLSRVWVLFDIYESDISWIKTGDEIEYTVQSFPGEKFRGKVSFIDPVINPNTRVVKARVTTVNKGNRLKPEMFVSGVLRSPVRGGVSKIIVPKTAVMWTGERSVVYVKSNQTKGFNFMMREVTLGSVLGDGYIIKDGLEDGEEIAINGTFSIDAAAQLAGKPSMMNPSGGVAITGHNHGGSSSVTSNTNQIVKEVQSLEAKKTL